MLDDARQRSEHGYGYPRFVEQTFRRYIECGRLELGFCRVRCSGCGFERLLAFSCKRRSVCPSCEARRMADTAAHLCDRVLPIVPYRQWVLSLPIAARLLLARDASLVSDVLRMALRRIFAWQRRMARGLGMLHRRAERGDFDADDEPRDETSSPTLSLALPPAARRTPDASWEHPRTSVRRCAHVDGYSLHAQTSIEAP